MSVRNTDDDQILICWKISFINMLIKGSSFPIAHKSNIFLSMNFYVFRFHMDNICLWSYLCLSFLFLEILVVVSKEFSSFLVYGLCLHVSNCQGWFLVSSLILIPFSTYLSSISVWNVIFFNFLFKNPQGQVIPLWGV